MYQTGNTIFVVSWNEIRILLYLHMHSKLTKENDFLHLKEILIFSFGIVLVHAGHDVSDTYVQ